MRSKKKKNNTKKKISLGAFNLRKIKKAWRSFFGGSFFFVLKKVLLQQWNSLGITGDTSMCLYIKKNHPSKRTIYLYSILFYMYMYMYKKKRELGNVNTRRTIYKKKKKCSRRIFVIRELTLAIKKKKEGIFLLSGFVHFRTL